MQKFNATVNTYYRKVVLGQASCPSVDAGIDLHGVLDSFVLASQRSLPFKAPSLLVWPHPSLSGRVPSSFVLEEDAFGEQHTLPFFTLQRSFRLVLLYRFDFLFG